MPCFRLTDVLAIIKKRSFLDAAPAGIAGEWSGRGRTRNFGDRRRHIGSEPFGGVEGGEVIVWVP